MKQTRESWEADTSGPDEWEVEGSQQGVGSLWKLAAVMLATWGWVLLAALMLIEFGEML